MSSRWPDKYIVGLTGNIATGKSVVLRLAAEQGALVLDADQVVHKLLDENHLVQEQIVNQFGDRVRLPEGHIDREAVATIVFNDPVALSKLEKIVHPAVRKDLFHQIEESDNQVVFIEAIKLLEGSLITVCQELWVTRCPRDVQIHRLVTYREMDREMAVTRVDAQTPQIHKVALADVVIDTSGTLVETRVYFKLAWAGLIRRAKLEGDLDSASDLPGYETMLSKSTEVVNDHTEEHEDVDIRADIARVRPVDFLPVPEITVRRAQLDDLDLVIDFIAAAGNDDSQQTRDDLISSFHQHSYLIAQKASVIRGVIGWKTENWVTAIDRVVLFPGNSVVVLTDLLLEEVVAHAQEVVNEAVLAALDRDASPELHDLYLDLGFEYVDSQSLPNDWQKMVEEIYSDSQVILIKILRYTRKIKIRSLTRERALGEFSQ